MKSSGRCLAPWRALTVKTNGEVVPDIHFQGAIGQIRSTSLRDMLSSPALSALRETMLRDEWPDSCSRCRAKENSVGHSRRRFFTDWLREDPDALTSNSAPSLVYLDVNFSNKCNLKCRMCSGQVSTAWIKDEEKLAALNNDYSRPPLFEHQKLTAKEMIKFIDDPALLADLRHLALRGGEPFLEEENLIFLERLIQWGLAPKISLDISTNLTAYSPRLAQAAGCFKQLDLYISIEGTNELYEYVRGGESFSFKQFEQNLNKFRQLPNVTVMFTVAVSIYNILYLDRIWNWYVAERKFGEEISLTNVVVHPDYLNFQNMPEPLRALALERLIALPAPRGPLHSGKRLLGDPGLLLIEEGLKKSSPLGQAELWRKFVRFNKDLDKIRKTNWLDIAPEFAAYY